MAPPEAIHGRTRATTLEKYRSYQNGEEPSSGEQTSEGRVLVRAPMLSVKKSLVSSGGKEGKEGSEKSKIGQVTLSGIKRKDTLRIACRRERVRSIFEEGEAKNIRRGEGLKKGEDRF